MADDAEKFWSDFERDTGEKVESRCMGAWYEKDGDGRGLWGLLILTDQNFRFKHLPSENWIMSSFRIHKPSSTPKQPIDIVAPKGDIVSVFAPKRGFFARFFGPAFPQFKISWRDAADGSIHEEVFSTDPSGDLLSRLVALKS